MLKTYKSPRIDQTEAELIQAGGNIIHFDIHKPTNSIQNKEDLTLQWKEFIIVPISKGGDKTD
jgi:hypothetical protein